jgi:hypothetical protein
MLHAPNTDNTGLTTHELICALVHRLDAPDCLHSMLALMVEASDALPISKQVRTAGSLIDAAGMILERPAVQGWAGRLGLNKEGASWPCSTKL